jgi:uncharacterized protein YqeY
MSTLKARLREDMTAALKSQDELTLAALRMALTAVQVAEVAGKRARALSEEEVLAVLTREAKMRSESAEAFDGAGRSDLATRERAAGAVLARYLPTPLSAEEIADLVRAAIAEAGATETRQMGQVMRLLQPRTAGRADGRLLAEQVRRQLASG